MNIVILGSGNIGGTLGKKWAAAGHQVTYGARNPDDPKYAELLDLSNIRVTTVAQAVAAGEVLLLAIPGGAVVDILAQVHDLLDDKVIMDATNNVRQAELNSFAAITTAAPGARLYRAFSTLGWENFKTPEINGQQVDLFYCGDEGESKTTIETLIADVGLRPVYVGDQEQVGVVDGLTRLWFALAFGQSRGRRLAFKMLAE